MAQLDQNWNLFGYDVRQLSRHWRAAWREFLWGYDSPVKARLDEGLKVHSEQGVEYFHAGQRVGQLSTNAAAQPGDECEAVLLPASLVLSKTVEMPLAVENDLELAMALEVTANSPFPKSDTGYGWRLAHRDDKNLRVQLAIVSLSSTMSYLGQQYNCHDAQAREVWADVGDAVIVLSGFGEPTRLQRYNKRLVKVASTIVYIVLLLVGLFGAAAGMKYLELQQLRSASQQVQERAGEAMSMRGEIVAANEIIATVNGMVGQRPSPHVELVRMTNLLGDDASLIQFTMQAGNLAIRGVADDAAVVVQQLTEQSAYTGVSSPQAITKYFNTGQEQFFLNIELASAEPGVGESE